MKALFIMILACFAYIETYCFIQVKKRYKWLSERNRNRRMNEYRRKAYADVQRESAIKRNRESLWEVYR